MGAGASSAKAAKGTLDAARRVYPTRVPPTNVPRQTPPRQEQTPGQSLEQTAGPTVHPKTHATSVRDDTITRDAADPDFAASLRSLGPVIPSPTASNSSTFNATPSPSQNMTTQFPDTPSSVTQSPSPTKPLFPSARDSPSILILENRARILREAEGELQELGTESARRAGRKYMDILHITEALNMRDSKNMSNAEIEKAMGLATGTMNKFGRRGVVANVKT